MKKVDEIFKDMPPNPNRRLYHLVIGASASIPPLVRIGKEEQITNFIESICAYPPLIMGGCAYFSFDGNPKWILSEIFKIGDVGATLIQLHPESLYSTFDDVFLYAYYFHNANGYLYPEETVNQVKLKNPQTL